MYTLERLIMIREATIPAVHPLAALSLAQQNAQQQIRLVVVIAILRLRLLVSLLISKKYSLSLSAPLFLSPSLPPRSFFLSLPLSSSFSLFLPDLSPSYVVKETGGSDCPKIVLIFDYFFLW